MKAQLKTLLWKDYRLSGLILIAGVFFLAVPYLLWMVFPQSWQWHLQHSWVFSTSLSQFIMSLMAGSIIASERVDRSAEFLAFQGAPRKILIASKLILCILVFTIICSIDIILSYWVPPADFGSRKEVIAFIIAAFSTGMCFFGSCWLWSSLPVSPVPAIVFGSITPLLILWALVASDYFFKWANDRNVLVMYVGLAIGIGILALFAGTWRYIKFKEA